MVNFTKLKEHLYQVLHSLAATIKEAENVPTMIHTRYHLKSHYKSH